MHGVNGSDGDVHGILGILGRDGSVFYQVMSQCVAFQIDLKRFDTLKLTEPGLGRNFIPLTGLFHYKLGDEGFVILQAVPEIMGGRLMPRHNKVFRWPCCQVAYIGGFNVNRGFHRMSLPP